MYSGGRKTVNAQAMTITIECKETLRRLRAVARRRGVAPERYAEELLAASLPPEPAPSRTGAGWLDRFNAWADGHPSREALPADAFDRASFYPEAR